MVVPWKSLFKRRCESLRRQRHSLHIKGAAFKVKYLFCETLESLN